MSAVENKVPYHLRLAHFIQYACEIKVVNHLDSSISINIIELLNNIATSTR